MPQLTIEIPLAAWLEARDPRLAGRVQPAEVSPPTADPYLTHTRVGTSTWRHLTGTTGTHQARVQLDVWGRDWAQVQDVAAKVRGSKADPGLNGFRGDMGGVRVDSAWLADVAFETEDPEDGTEGAWHRARMDFVITWHEGA